MPDLADYLKKDDSSPSLHPLRIAADKAVELGVNSTADDVETVKKLLAPAMFPNQALYDGAIAQLDWIAVNVSPAEALEQASGYLTYVRTSRNPTLTWEQYFDGTHGSQTIVHIELARNNYAAINPG